MATKVKVLHDTREWVTREPYDDGWDRGDTEQSHTINGIEVAKDWGDIDVRFKVEPDKDYYLLYVIYGTGDTFGHDAGRINFIDLFQKRARAEENAKRIAEHARSPGDYFRKVDALTLLTNGGTEYKFHPTWIGYFDCFEYAEVEAVRIGSRRFT